MKGRKSVETGAECSIGWLFKGRTVTNSIFELVTVDSTDASKFCDPFCKLMLCLYSVGARQGDGVFVRELFGDSRFCLARSHDSYEDYSLYVHVHGKSAHSVC